ncbi:MAG: AAA family ATPase [Oscillospiraceae bacterium]|nr:AAA family ATPase [Oscillospiraceae bacterium]
MKMKRLSASFGALQNQRLTFAPGLNIVHGPNERGKSTWCAFIRAMLYGINTSERNKDGVLAEKTKYRPWSGHAMEGIMEVEIEDGRSVAIQRTALGTSPMKKLDVRYSGSGEEVTALMNDNLGETLTGVPEAVFVRSAFIRQAGLKVAQTGQLEQRIAALVSSGEEGVSYRDTTGILGAWQRKRRHNKTGQIPALEAEIAAIDQALERLAEASIAYNEVSLDLDRVMARTHELRADHDAILELERRTARKNIMEARDKLRELDLEIEALRKQLTYKGAEIQKETLVEAQENHDKLISLSMKHTDAKADKEAAGRDLELIEEEKRNTSFGGRNITEAKELVAQAEAANREADEAAAFNKQKYTFPLAALPVLALAALALDLVSDWTIIPLWPISVLALIATGILGFQFYRKWKFAAEAEKKRGEAFVRLRVGNIEDLQREFVGYQHLCEQAEVHSAVLEAAEQTADQIKADMQTCKDTFEQQVQSVSDEAGDFAAASETLTALRKRMDRLELANSERVAAAHLDTALTTNYDGDPLQPIPQDSLELPLMNKNEALYELKRSEKELDSLKNNYALALGEVRALGDPVVLGAKRGGMVSRLRDLTRQHEALGLALDVLAEADSEIAARFSPLLGQRAGYYLDRLTDGGYKRVVFDKNLSPSTERAGESVSRDILYLSGGTIDQVYLALRLAICDMVFPPEKACPIILDDALVSFDEGRMCKALDLLKELAAERQIILFSCHKREAAYLAGGTDVNIVRL